ncbi:MAG: hypothetical protein RLZZ245_3162, partial [Verrucomicrobiota bacterium]
VGPGLESFGAGWFVVGGESLAA